MRLSLGKCLLLLIALCSLTIGGKAQSFGPILKAIQNSDMSLAIQQMRSSSWDSSLSIYYPIVYQEICPEYEELLIEYQDSSYKNQVQGSTVYYRIQSIRHNKEIVFCEVFQLNGEKRTSIYRRKDEPAIAQLDSIYSLSNSKPLNWNKLFNENQIYGAHCGWIGIDPTFRVWLDQQIKNKDNTLFRQWIYSSIPEIRAYGVEGFYLLQKEGIKPNQQQQNRIDFILSQSNSITTCFGCIKTNEQLKDLNFRFVFD